MWHGLRVALPAAAAVLWALQKLRPSGPPRPNPEQEAEQDEGEQVEVELPAGGKGGAGFAEPPPLKTTLLDVTLPMPLAALWLAMFANSSSLLAEFHQQLGDLDIRVAPWKRSKGEEARRRLMRYTTPLKNVMGPRQAYNTEVLEVLQLEPSGFVLAARCSSEGVPFAGKFANHIQWVATPAGAHSCRLLVTGECRFSSPVWGPLKGQIERESVKGMTKAYRTFLRMLERKYGATEAAPAGMSSSSGRAAGSSKAASRRPVAVGADGTAAGQAGGAAAGGAGGEGLNISALLQNPQTNAAAFLALMVVMVILWRLAFMHQAMVLQVARGVASAVRR